MNLTKCTIQEVITEGDKLGLVAWINKDYGFKEIIVWNTRPVTDNITKEIMKLDVINKECLIKLTALGWVFHKFI